LSKYEFCSVSAEKDVLDSLFREGGDIGDGNKVYAFGRTTPRTRPGEKKRQQGKIRHQSFQTKKLKFVRLKKGGKVNRGSTKS